MPVAEVAPRTADPATPELLAVSPVKRAVFVTLGLALVGVGAIGAVVPGLPTTIFLLAASYFFARSSPRLQRWLLSHRLFGPYLRSWQRHRALSPRTKTTALLSMWLAVTLSCAALLIGGATFVLPGLIFGLACVGTGVIVFAVPTLTPEQARGDGDSEAP